MCLKLKLELWNWTVEGMQRAAFIKQITEFH